MAKRTPSGKFRGKVTIGYDPDGKPIYKYVTAPTRRERSGFPTSSRWRRAMRRARSGIMMRSSPPKSVSPQGNQGGVPERWRALPAAVHSQALPLAARRPRGLEWPA